MCPIVRTGLAWHWPVIARLSEWTQPNSCLDNIIHAHLCHTLVCAVMEDYLPTPYQQSTMPRNRSKSVSSRLTQPEVVRNTPLRASSFSPGSVAVRGRLCFPKLSFRSKSTSMANFSPSTSCSSSSSQKSGSSEHFWNQYRRSLPRSSFTKLLRTALTNSKVSEDSIPVETEWEEPAGPSM